MGEGVETAFLTGNVLAAMLVGGISVYAIFRVVMNYLGPRQRAPEPLPEEDSISALRDAESAAWQPQFLDTVKDLTKALTSLKDSSISGEITQELTQAIVELRAEIANFALVQKGQGEEIRRMQSDLLAIKAQGSTIIARQKKIFNKLAPDQFIPEEV